jgi:hypothetical protein
MLRPIRFFLSLALLSTITACANDRVTGVAATANDQDALFAAATSDPDSKARYTFYLVMPDDAHPTGIVGDNRLADGSSANAGASVYEGGKCGVHGKIFWYDQSLSESGDAVLDPDKNRATCGAARKLNIAPFGAVGPSMNFAAIMQLTGTESRDHQLNMTLYIKGCERLMYTAEVGSAVRVTRLSGDATGTPGSWRAESVGNHRAGCYNSSKYGYKYSGVWYYLTMNVLIEELR